MAHRAVASVSKDAEYYKMNHRRRGLALIFNQQKFPQEEANLAGSTADVTTLKKCLGDVLRFEVYVFNDLDLEEIKQQINDAAAEDHSDADCIVVVVLSHGGENRVHAFDKQYDPRKVIFEKFNGDKCPSLAGKPKIFIVQACRGGGLDRGVEMHSFLQLSCTQAGSYKLPSTADFIEIYATSIGYVAYQHQKHGGYFIQVLCEELTKRHKKEHLGDILVAVKRRVATEFQANSRCQMPRVDSSLTRKVYFG